jgi:hypothetical protein
MPYSVTLIKGVPSTTRRGIAFLESSADGDVNAKEVFDKLKEKIGRDLRSRFGYWLDGNTCDKYFHGRPGDKDHKHCFVFKWKEAGTYHRLYGFLFNPKPSTDPAFQVCILVSHARKNTEETDTTVLNAVSALSAKEEVINAVRAVFPDGSEEQENSHAKRTALDRRKR